MEVLWTAASEKDTERLAHKLADRMKPGSVIALEGELGAGKTTFAQAFARALGVSGTVNSPTFTIIKEYEDGRLPFYHMDVYRISQAEADELGLEEYFYGDGIALVEWASRISDLLPAERLDVHIAGSGYAERTITLRPIGLFYEEICRQLERMRS